MKVISRMIESTTQTVEGTECQASFNSDGRLTLRTFSIGNKNHDTIMVLSEAETKAIFLLLKQMGELKNVDYTIPF